MSVTYEEVMTELEGYGTEQNRKIYKRHGCGENLFGVSTANLIKMKKKLKKNQALAEELWASGNMDACVLATMIAEPKEFTASLANKWVKNVEFHCIGAYFARVIAKTSFAKKKMEQWMKSPKEHYRQCGYNILTDLLKSESEEISEEECKKYLKTIKEEIHDSPNRAKYAMNNSVIAIGTYKMEKEAIATAKKIGEVEVDHKDTSCKTPEAVSYIKKARAKFLEKKEKAKKKKAKKKK